MWMRAKKMHQETEMYYLSEMPEELGGGVILLSGDEVLTCTWPLYNRIDSKVRLPYPAEKDSIEYLIAVPDRVFWGSLGSPCCSTETVRIPIESNRVMLSEGFYVDFRGGHMDGIWAVVPGSIEVGHED